MVGVIWYRFVRYSGTDWSATLVPIRPLLWYRLERCAGTDSSATVVPIRRYYHQRHRSWYGSIANTHSAGRGFMRLNVGCPRSILQQAMFQLLNAYRTYQRK